MVKRTTIVDVAMAVNLSKTTVSMVLNNKPINVTEETKNRILAAAKELNYIPNSSARNLSTKKSFTIGVILPDIQNPFFSEMAKAIELQGEKQGYSMILCNTLGRKEKEETYATLLISKSVDGVILVPCGESEGTIDLLKRHQIPFVFVDRGEGHEGVSGVYSDNEQGIKQGIEYLLAKGHRRIAFVSGKEPGIVQSRCQYFQQYGQEHGIFAEELTKVAEFSLEGGIQGTKALIESGQSIDSIFYGSDVMAIGGMKYLIQQGYRIPEDISILGYDNIAISSFVEPELTTVAQGIYQMGERAFDLLLSTMKQEEKRSEVIRLSTLLVERKTVKSKIKG